MFSASVNVKAKIAIAFKEDIHLEFVGNGSNLQEIVLGSQELVKDYVAKNSIKASKVEIQYVNKDGFIIDTIEDITSL